MDKNSEFMKHIDQSFSLARQLKAAMLKKGKRSGWTKCPRCEQGKVRATLNGRKDHIHMACSTKGCIWLME